MEAAVKVVELQKSYGNKQVLRGISFDVKKGEIFALLGINGAGKTTTLECLEGIRRYDGGEIFVAGRLGVQLQSASLPPNIKAMEALRLFARWNRTTVPVEYVERLGIADFQNQQYRSLSIGQKRRLHLAIALLGSPELVFLDEPTAGLDVEGRVALHAEIRRLREQGRTIILASHDMAEVEELCDRIAILKDGEIAFMGTAAALTEMWRDSRRIYIRFSPDATLSDLRHCTYQGMEQGNLVFETEDMPEALIELSALAKAQGLSIRDIKVERTTLEQRFIDIARGEN